MSAPISDDDIVQAVQDFIDRGETHFTTTGVLISIAGPDPQWTDDDFRRAEELLSGHLDLIRVWEVLR